MRVALVRSEQPERAGRADEPLPELLERRGVTVTRPCWDDPAVSWGELDLIVVRTTWDYASQRDAFLDWARTVDEKVPVLNPPDVLRWNSHKSYLVELEEAGAPVVPTAWLGQGDRVDVLEVLSARGWSEAVVKPAVGVGGRGLVRLSVDDPGEGPEEVARLLAAGDVLVQPFLERVVDRGELSVVVIDGEVSHAVRKRPAAGEYRVQQERGASLERVEPDADTAALARWAVEAVGQPLLFARVDLLEDDVGTLQVVELEAVEPDLYLPLATDGAGRLADAVVRRRAGG